MEMVKDVVRFVKDKDVNKMEDKNKKIGIIALIFALLALTQVTAISNVTMNLIAGSGINISQSGDNYTISATGTGINGSDNTKMNKSGDTVNVNDGVFYSKYHQLYTEYFDDNTSYAQYGIYSPESYLTINSNAILGTSVGSGNAFLKTSCAGIDCYSKWYASDGISNTSSLELDTYNGFDIYSKTTIHNNLNMSGKNITSSGRISFDTINQSIRIMSDSNSPTTSVYVVNETGGASSSSSFAGYVIWTRVYSNGTYNIDTLGTNIISATSGHFRMALYSGNSTAPGNVLNESASLVSVPGWSYATIPTTKILPNTYYWIGHQSQATTSDYYNSGGNSWQLSSFSYGTFPSPALGETYGNTMNLRMGYTVTTISGSVPYCLGVTVSGTLYTYSC